MSLQPVRVQEAERGKAPWEASMPLPKLDHAEQYDRILRALGHETRAPVQVEEGWIVYWRPRCKCTKRQQKAFRNRSLQQVRHG